MTMKKKLLTTLSVVLILGLAALGILAYLTDTDSDVNVMTLGNVDIEQTEYQRVVNDDGTYPIQKIDGVDSYKLEAFEQDKALLPIVGDPSISGSGYAGWDDTVVRMTQKGSYGSMQVFAGKNAQDKFVVVKNTGKTDAYVRTLVAIEVGSTDGSLIGTSYHNTWKKNEIGKVTIAGNNYNVFEYVYSGASDISRHVDGVLTAGDTAYPNLSQVYIKSIATNEDCENIDGNDNGMLDILVLSQAVQADGFENAQTALDTAFGTAAGKATDWFYEVLGYVSVSDSEELVEAIEKGEDVVLTEDVNVNSPIEVTSGEVTIDLNDNELTTSKAGEAGITASGTNAVVTIEGNNDAVIEDFILSAYDGGTINVNNVDVVNETTIPYDMGPLYIMGGTMNFNDATIKYDKKTKTGGIYIDSSLGNSTFNMNGGTIEIAKGTGIKVDADHAGTINVNLNSGTISADYYGVLVENSNATVNLKIKPGFALTATKKVYARVVNGNAMLNGQVMTDETEYTVW